MIFVSIAQGWFMDDDTGVEQFVEEFAKAHKDIFELDQVRCGLRILSRRCLGLLIIGCLVGCKLQVSPRTIHVF
jgi:hypothetical protein